jgi:hypothetical protein
MTLDLQEVRAWRNPGCPHMNASSHGERAGVSPGARD